MKKTLLVLSLVTISNTEFKEREPVKMVKFGRIWSNAPRSCYDVRGDEIVSRPDIKKENCKKVLKRYLE